MGGKNEKNKKGKKNTNTKPSRKQPEKNTNTKPSRKQTKRNTKPPKKQPEKNTNTKPSRKQTKRNTPTSCFKLCETVNPIRKANCKQKCKDIKSAKKRKILKKLNPGYNEKVSRDKGKNKS